EGRKVRKQTGSEWRREEDQGSKTSKGNQHTQNSREEGRPENEVANEDEMEPEEHDADVGSLSAERMEQERKRLQLFQTEDAPGARPSQDLQWAELEQVTESRNRTSKEAEQRRQQGDAPVHRPEQLVQESGHGKRARGRDE